MKDLKINDLMEDLDLVGLSSRLRMTISPGISTNQFLLTNLPKFLSLRREELKEIGVELDWSSVPFGENRYLIILTGLPWRVRETYKNILKWSWIDPEGTIIKSEEEIG
jgi:hypothetical protein